MTLGGNDFFGGAADINQPEAQGQLIKAGAGTLKLTGANSMDGGVRIDAGRLIADHNFALGTNPIFTVNVNEIKNGASLEIASGRSVVAQMTVRDGGSFFINGEFDPSSMTLNSGATLGGNGSFKNDNLIIPSGVHVSPGDNGTGTFTFDSNFSFILNGGSLLDFGLGTSSDLLRILKGTFFGPSGTGGITINISDAGGLANQDYTLIDWNGASTTNVDLTDFVLGAGSPDGTLSFGTNTLVYSAHGVPEPSTTAAMFAVGAVFLVGTRWRNRRRRAGRTAPRFSSDS